jgi:ATP-binding cassette, subfamily B, bacterial
MQHPPRFPRLRAAPWLARLRQSLAVYASLPSLFRLGAAASPRRVVAMFAIYLLFSLLQPTSVWFSKLLVDAVRLDQGTVALLIAGGYVALRVVGNAQGFVYEVVAAAFRDRALYYLHVRLMEKVTALPDLTIFDTSAFYDRLQRAREAVPRLYALVNQTVTGASIVLVFITLLGLLARLSPLAALIVFLTAIPTYFAQLRFAHGAWRVYGGQAPHARRLDYYSQVLTGDVTAKEVRLFGLGEFFLGRYRQTYTRVIADVEAFRHGQTKALLLLSGVSSCGAGAVLLYAVWQATRGSIGLGDLVLYVGAIFMVQSTVVSILTNAASLYDSVLQTSPIAAFLALESPMREAKPGRPFPQPWQGELELRDVAFRYPGVERPVLQSVSVTIRQGETVALVGENGAGKTTLVKLLCRLYDPTGGAIFLNGHDLREYNLGDLRKHMTVVFQDYARYALTAAENVGLADLDRLEDRAGIAAATVRAGADAVVATLPNGLDTPLGRQFDDGLELSIGQWQKLALARAFFRDAPLQILDEPTSALDAQAEYDVYLRFQELTHGRTTLLISHRFSTVRMADRILVLEGGRIVEAGSHAELVALGGRYATLYEMQAGRYR